MPSRYTATDAEAYELVTRRWSRALARELIAWAGISEGERVFDGSNRLDGARRRT
jgi:hypothetical protein